jgi:hypothetical protein
MKASFIQIVLLKGQYLQGFINRRKVMTAALYKRLIFLGDWKLNKEMNDLLV